MKIVIDIPEKWYRWAKFNNIDNGSMVSKGILDAVGNGAPLTSCCDCPIQERSICEEHQTQSLISRYQNDFMNKGERR